MLVSGLLDAGGHTITEVAATIGVGRGTLYRSTSAPHHQRRLMALVTKTVCEISPGLLRGQVKRVLQKRPVSEAFAERIADLTLPTLLAIGGMVAAFYFRPDGK
jgi:hypothetical protein